MEYQITIKIDLQPVKVKTEMTVSTDDVTIDNVTENIAKFFFSGNNQYFNFTMTLSTGSTCMDISKIREWMGLTDGYNYNSKEKEEFENHPLIKGRETIVVHFAIEDGNVFKLTKIA